jgi:hypothetical protein
MQKRTAFAILFLLTVSTLVLAQEKDKNKRPSPPAQATCKFSDGKVVTVNYSSPRAKGRKIFGTKDEKALVPYGEVWRTGANEATTMTTDANLTVGGQDIPAGTYTLFTIPDEGKWTLVVSKQTGEWGIPYPGQQYDLLRTEMVASKTPSPVENMTISFEQAGDKCTMHVDWADTRASVDFVEKK